MVSILTPFAARRVALYSVKGVMRYACGAAFCFESVPPPVVWLDAAVVHTDLTDPYGQSLPHLVRLWALNRAATGIAGVIKDRAGGQGRHHRDKALINQVRVKRHIPVSVRFDGPGLRRDVQDRNAVAPRHILLTKLRYLPDTSARIGA